MLRSRSFTAAHQADGGMKIVVAAASALSLWMLNASATPQDGAFQKIAHDYIEQYLRANPEDATELGDHRFDGQLTDYSPEAQAKELATQKEFRGKLSDIDGSQLTGANNIDFRILKENIDYQIFRAEELKEPEWNPLVYMQSLANSLYLLVARDFASPEQRIPNLRHRMEEIPRVIAQAKGNLQHSPRIYTETAVEQLQGAINLVREELAPLLDRAPQMKNELAPLQQKTAAALEDYKKWLQNDLLPRSDGNFRLGAEKFRKKLRFALASELSMEEIMKRAQADLKQTQTAIYETAVPIYKKYFPSADSATLADKHKVTAAVLDKLAEQHPDDATVVGYAKEVVGEATNFVRSHNLVTIPDTPLDVIAMPEFKRGVAIAYCDSPGPLDKTGKTFFAVAPTPKDWGGLEGHDLAAVGLPTEQEMVAYYCELSKRALPDPALWEFYMAYNLFRVSCIRQGVYARALDGTAANVRAAESGKLVRPAADLAWEIVGSMGGGFR